LAFGEMGDALLLASQRVEPAKLVESGYQFRFPRLESALENILRS
jgi:NAD dependent epimerase/dehydratase family enzyme